LTMPEQVLRMDCFWHGVFRAKDVPIRIIIAEACLRSASFDYPKERSIVCCSVLAQPAIVLSLGVPDTPRGAKCCTFETYPQGEYQETPNVVFSLGVVLYPKESTIVVCARFEQCNIVFSLGVRGYPKESIKERGRRVPERGVSVQCTTLVFSWGVVEPSGSTNRVLCWA